ncbi:hypothetical protein Scep_030857 [Stephania cephalantha]|uniref:F-box domain-containing protein n=1 Tax=Stephania cephalantha TaxID=152367 RepID=A0AAP0E0K8_9MAGN
MPSMKMKNHKKNNKKYEKEKKKKGKYKSWSEDILEDIVIYEVLPHLPLKVLCRFKSVCREWNRIISNDPVFVDSHIRKGPNSTNFTESSFLCKKREYVISSDPWYHQFNLSEPDFGNCICNTIHGLIYGFADMCYQIYIYNPFTKHDPIYIPNPKCRLKVTLAYDPYNNPSFGFAIVALVQLEEGSNCYAFEVYSSKTREWRVSKAKMEIPSYKLLRGFNAVFSKGKVYWSVVNHILWFDVEKDVAGLIRSPDSKNFVYIDPYKKPAFQDLGVCNGKGGELSYTMLTKEGNIEVWLLRGDVHKKFEWEKRYIVRLPEIVQQNWLKLKRYFNPMKVWNRDAVAKSLVRRREIFPVQYVGGEVVWFLIDFKTYYVVCSFNTRTQELKVIHDDLPLPLDPFIPTLLPCPA